MPTDPDAEETPSERRMTFFEHLEELRARLKVVIVFILIFFVFFIGFNIVPVTIGETTILLPIPGILTESNEVIADRVFNYFVEQYKPPNVNLTTLHPWDGVVVEVKVAFFLALLAAAPVTAYEFGKFVGPAMKPSEKRMVARIAAPVLTLFIAGVLIAHFVVLPFTFDYLFSVSARLGVDFPLLFVDDFISFITVFIVAFALAFQLPIVMYALGAVGLVDSGFWARNWRYAIIVIFIFGAIVTPDGSGVTMVLVAIPMVVLYAIGYAAIVFRERRRRAKSS